VRLKYRADRRTGMPIVPIGLFHVRLAVETWKKLGIYVRLAWQGWRIGRKVGRDPRRHAYMDLALSPVVEEDMDKLALFADTAGGEAALSKRRGEDLARDRIAAARNQRLAAAE
jgi:hypothetical protein